MKRTSINKNFNKIKKACYNRKMYVLAINYFCEFIFIIIIIIIIRILISKIVGQQEDQINKPLFFRFACYKLVSLGRRPWSTCLTFIGVNFFSLYPGSKSFLYRALREVQARSRLDRLFLGFWKLYKVFNLVLNQFAFIVLYIFFKKTKVF